MLVGKDGYGWGMGATAETGLDWGYRIVNTGWAY